MLYMARFSFDEQGGKRDERGGFEVVLEADDPESAVESCRRYLMRYQKKKETPFSGKVALYLDDILEVKLPLARPALVNYRCYAAKLEHSEIINPKLDGPSSISVYGWGETDENGEPDEEAPLVPFLTFDATKPSKKPPTKRKRG